MKKTLFLLLGILAFALGCVGVVLPVLPTTPLLLLALFCFSQSSQKLHDWFLGTWLYKRYLAEYVRTKTMTLPQKLFIQILAGIMMAIGFFSMQNWILRIILLVLFAIHNFVFIFKIKTRKKPEKQNK